MRIWDIFSSTFHGGIRIYDFYFPNHLSEYTHLSLYIPSPLVVPLQRFYFILTFNKIYTKELGDMSPSSLDLTMFYLNFSLQVVMKWRN